MQWAGWVSDQWLCSAARGQSRAPSQEIQQFSTQLSERRWGGGGEVLHDHAAITWYWSVTVETDYQLILRQRERVCTNETSQGRFTQQWDSTEN